MRIATVLFVHQRPRLAEQILDMIASADRQTVIILADGAISERERLACEATRRTVSRFSATPQVVHHFSSSNQGLGVHGAIPSGLDRVFRTYEAAILLEDDCFPHPDFFKFCDDLLRYYRHDGRVMMLRGFTPVPVRPGKAEPSYFFSKVPVVWGWATWARAWRVCDASLRAWPTVRNTRFLKDALGDDAEAARWHERFEQTANSYETPWDIAWYFALWLSGGLVVAPCSNLVDNVGWDAAATHRHYVHRTGRLASPARRISFPLHHPPSVRWDHLADKATSRFFHPHFF